MNKYVIQSLYIISLCAKIPFRNIAYREKKQVYDKIDAYERAWRYRYLYSICDSGKLRRFLTRHLCYDNYK